MKKFCIASIMILLFAFPVLNQVAQEVELESEDVDFKEYVIGYVPVKPQIQSPDHNPYVKALCIGLSWELPEQPEWASLDFATEWDSSQDWYIVFVVVNYSNQDVKVKVEMEMMYNDGKSRLYKKSNKTIESGYVMLYPLPVTRQVRNGFGDLFTLNGRVSGAGMGNTNEVQSQVFIY